MAARSSIPFVLHTSLNVNRNGIIEIRSNELKMVVFICLWSRLPICNSFCNRFIVLTLFIDEAVGMVFQCVSESIVHQGSYLGSLSFERWFCDCSSKTNQNQNMTCRTWSTYSALTNISAFPWPRWQRRERVRCFERQRSDSSSSSLSLEEGLCAEYLRLGINTDFEVAAFCGRAQYGSFHLFFHLGGNMFCGDSFTNSALNERSDRFHKRAGCDYLSVHFVSIIAEVKIGRYVPVKIVSNHFPAQ